MNSRPSELTKAIREAINNLEQYRDHPETFTLEDHDYPEYALQQIMDDARHAGCSSVAQSMPKRVNVREALDILARMLEQVTGTAVVLPLLLSKDEVAAMLGISVRTIDRMKSAGELPEPVEVHGSKKWRRTDILEQFEIV